MSLSPARARALAVGLSTSWTLALVYLLSAPVPDVGPLFPGVDKVVHFGLFFVWGCLWMWAVGRPWGVVIGGLALAVATEWVQAALLPHRSGDLVDAAVDLAGVLVGVPVAAWLLPRPRTPAPQKNAA